LSKNLNVTSEGDLEVFGPADAGHFAVAPAPAPQVAAQAAPISDALISNDTKATATDLVTAHLTDFKDGLGRTSSDFFADLSTLLGSKATSLATESFVASVSGAVDHGSPLVDTAPTSDTGAAGAPVFAAESMLVAAAAAPKPPVIGGTAPQQAFKQLWSASDIPTDTLFSQQWNLLNTGQNGGVKGVDINVLPAWHMGYTGKGVSVGVFDTAVDATHADLVKNIDLSKVITSSMVPDHTYVDPTKIVSSALDSHATAVAGIIAASKDGQGVVGIAYDAKFTPVDILGAQAGNYGWEASWLQKNFDITNNSWGFTTPFSVGQLDASSQYWVLSGFKTAADQGRGGLGTIVNLASGNYRQTGMTAELTGPTVDRHAIVVGATDDHGFVSYYSNGGASLLGVAPSSGLTTGITTDDITGSLGYSSGNTTNTFGGTSAATPEFAGIEALMLQANPLLGWRDVQDILALSMRHVGTAINNGISGYEQDAWSFNHATNVNGGGMHFSNDYGFGLVDAAAAVRLAETWGAVHATAGTSANEVALSSTYTGSLDIGHARTNVLTFNITGHESVESMVLDLTNLNINHANNLTVTLTSPSGTVSQLLTNNGGSNASISGGWELMSREFLGEDAYGQWKVTITDSNASDIGSLSSAKLTAYGSSIANNSIAYYTDEFVTYANADPSRALVGSGITAIDAAAVTGATNVNLSTKVASIDGKAIFIGATTNINTVVGGGGDDVLVGNNLSNKLYGGQGNDIISGGYGADYLDGGAGNNIINTGGGADRVMLHANGFDSIIDFAIGIDKLLLSKTEFSAFASKGFDSASFVTGTSSTHVAGGGFVQAGSDLFYDADGHSALTLIAHLNNAAKLSANDLVLVA
jgi:subtilisin-like proprotein convertase family protein